MTWVAAAIVSSAVVGSIASNRAADKQAGAARDVADMSSDQYDRQLAFEREQFDKTFDLYKKQYDEQLARQEPFRFAGLAAQNRLMSLLGIGDNKTAPDYGKYARDFSMADFEADPGYGFRLSEGLKALERSTAARRGLISGKALKDSQRFGQEMASQEFINAFNRYQANRANQIQPLQGFLTGGQSATNAIGAAGSDFVGGVSGASSGMLGRVGAAGQNFVNTTGNAMIGGANARAGGIMGGANAFSQGLGQYLNYQQFNRLLNRMPSTGGSSMSNWWEG